MDDQHDQPQDEQPDEQLHEPQDMTTEIPMPGDAVADDAVADGDEPTTDSPRRGRLRAAAPYALAGAIGLAAGVGAVGLMHGLDGDGHDGRSADHVEMRGGDGHMGRGGMQQRGDQQMQGGFQQPGEHGPMQGRSGGS